MAHRESNGQATDDVRVSLFGPPCISDGQLHAPICITIDKHYNLNRKEYTLTVAAMTNKQQHRPNINEKQRSLWLYASSHLYTWTSVSCAVAPDTLPGKDQSTHKQLGPTCSRG